MIRRLIDHRPIIVRMPASRPSMPPFVWRRPVMKPATRPAPIAASVARNGLTPAMMREAAVAPPVVKLPSTVRSGKLRTLKVR